MKILDNAGAMDANAHRAGKSAPITPTKKPLVANHDKK
jgi:hypothetical protein